MRALPAKTREKEKIAPRPKNSIFVWIIPVVFFLDRILKSIVIKNYPEGDGFAIVPGVFHVTRVNNTGAAFGMLKGYGGLLILVSTGCVLLLATHFFRHIFLNFRQAKTTSYAIGLTPIAWSLIIAGAAGNLYDRLRYGYVIDFLDFRIWPVFNIADGSICLGVFLIAASFLKNKKI